MPSALAAMSMRSDGRSSSVSAGILEVGPGDGPPVPWRRYPAPTRAIAIPIVNARRKGLRTETSIMLALAPAGVRLELARPGNTAPLAELMPAMRARSVRAVSDSGVLGDPSGASAEEGRAMLAALVDGCVRAVLRPPDG